MRKFFALFIAIAAIAACETPVDTDKEKEKNNKPKPEPEVPQPAVTSGLVSSITEIAATIDGTAANYDGLVNVEIGVLVSTSPSVYESESMKYVAEAVNYGKFSVRVTDLSPATKYYYRSYLKADGVSLTGKSKDFTTQDVWVTVTVSDTTNFTLTSTTTVTGNVQLRASAAYPITASLFWGKDITTSGKLVSEGTEIPLTLDENGNFTAQFGPFSYDATYAYVVRAQVLGRSSFCPLKKFSTPGFEAYVTTSDATDVGSTQATFHGSYTVNYDAGYRLAKVFLYSTVEGTPQYWIDNNLITEQEGYVYVFSWGNNPDFSSTVRNLKPSTTYYYAAAIGRLDDNWNVMNAWFGNVKSFTTSAEQP